MSNSKNRVKNIVKSVRHYQEEFEKENKTSKYMTDSCNTLTNNEHKRLNVIVDTKTGELLSKPKCSYRYYTQLMENYRSGIKALGFKHHAIERNIKSFLRKYGIKNKELFKKIDSSLAIEKLRENIILLRADTITGSEFRSDLLSLRIEHHAFYMFEPKGAVKDWIRDDDKKQLNKKLHSQILVNPEWVKSLSHDLLTKKSPSTSELCIGIAIATGRRLTEIMKTAKLKVVDDETLLFSGQLKTKNRHLFEDITSYKIPSMIKAEIVVKALNKIRNDTSKDLLKYNDVLGEPVECTVSEGDVKDYDHNRAVQKKYESTINRAVRSLLQNGNFSLKACRALYTEVTYEEHAKDGEARSAYRHRVLGHSLIETQLHYESFKIDKTINSIKLIEEEKTEQNSDQQQALVDYLTLADSIVNCYARAPKIAIMHAWLKNEVSNGLLIEKITPSYIRRHCLIDGKQLNLNTIKKYVEEFIKLSQYTPPKPKDKKPESKKAQEIYDLEVKIEEMQTRVTDISDEREGLDDELVQLKERIEEVEEEDEELELEQESLNDELEDMQFKLSELETELEAEQAKKENGQKNEIAEPELQWPDADDIDIQAKKDGKMWHVWSSVNGKTFEQWTGGRKTLAIKELRNYYRKSVAKLVN